MSRLRYADILVEMIELCLERVGEIRQQLVYYRASVYKGEMSGHVSEAINKLRLLANLLGDVLIQDAFKDYDAMATHGVLQPLPGECTFSQRVMSLLANLEHGLGKASLEIVVRSANPTPEHDEEIATVRKHRSQLLQLCREGSRHWTFFQAI